MDFVFCMVELKKAEGAPLFPAVPEEAAGAFSGGYENSQLLRYYTMAMMCGAG